MTPFLFFLIVMTMPDISVRQIQYEREAWKKLIFYMMEENTQMKTRLAEILKNKSNTTLVDFLEKMQNKLLHLDDLFSLLRNHLSNLDDISEYSPRNPELREDFVRRLVIIRNIAGNTEQQFILSRNEFYQTILALLEQQANTDVPTP